MGGATEFQRATAAVETLEALVLDLAGSSGLSEAPSASLPAFPFSPQPRTETGADGDWVVVVGLEGAVEGGVSEEQRAKFQEAERLLADLEPVEARLRRKTEARASAEEVRERLRQMLPAAAAAAEAADVMRAAQDLAAEGAEGARELAALLEEAVALDAAATYGVKMVEKVHDLLDRLDTVRGRFRAGVVPRLGAAVACADVEEAERRAAAAAEFEALERSAEEAARRPATELLAAAEQKLRQQREAEVGSEWHCVQRPSGWAPGSAGAGCAAKISASIYS